MDCSEKHISILGAQLRGTGVLLKGIFVEGLRTFHGV